MQGVFVVHSLLMKFWKKCDTILEVIFFVLDLTEQWRKIYGQK